MKPSEEGEPRQGTEAMVGKGRTHRGMAHRRHDPMRPRIQSALDHILHIARDPDNRARPRSSDRIVQLTSPFSPTHGLRYEERERPTSK